MMLLRRMMLRRKTDPKTGKHTLCEPVQSKCTRTLHKSCVEIYRKSAVRQAPDTRFVRACTVEMHMDMSEEAFCAEIYRENTGRFSRGQRFVRACAVEMHMDMSQEVFCAEIYREDAGPVSRGKHFMRACAVEMHMDMSQEAFCAEIFGKCQTPWIPPRLNTGP